jgi:hypothetical protein
MKRTGIIMLTLVLLLPLGCKNKERALESVDELPLSRTERGPDLALPIRIIDTPIDNWITIDTLNSEAAKQMSIGNIYLSRISRALFKTQFGFLIEGDLPDGCSYLHDVKLRFDGDTVEVVAQSRRDPSAMCTQALVPFSYFAPVEDDNAFTAAKRWKSGDTTANID